jgi:hypothetical protein
MALITKTIVIIYNDQMINMPQIQSILWHAIPGVQVLPFTNLTGGISPPADHSTTTGWPQADPA